MKQYKASLRYARAFFEVSRDSDNLEQAVKDLDLIESVLLEAPEILPFFVSLVAKVKERKRLMERSFKPYVSDLTWRFLELLLKRNRLGVLEWVPQVFQRYYDEHAGIVETKLEGVYQLSQEELNGIKEKLEAKTQKKIRMDFTLNKKLVGGFKLYVGDQLIDCSLANQLKRIRKDMLAT